MSGFVLMAFEMVAARVAAPTIGSSTYVWTSVIGVIITALSLGFWWGGRLADTRARLHDVAWLSLAAAGAIAAMLVLYPAVLDWLAEQTGWDMRLRAVTAATLLFAPASFLLGTLSPYLARLNIRDIDHAGSAVANLSALNAIGGISGTFLTGFVLFGEIGSRRIGMLLVLLMVACAWAAAAAPRARLAAATVAITVLACAPSATADTIQLDTAAAHYSVQSHYTGPAQTRTLATGPGGYQSAIYLSAPDELAFWYTRELAAVVQAAPAPQRIAVLGGGALTLPRALASQHPDSRIDVIEIDGGLAQIAREYFAYNDPPNVRLITADARSYVNTTAEQYDVVLVDVFGDADIPPTFMSREYGVALRRITRPNGIVAVNIIAGTRGDCGQLLAAVAAPYREYFSQARLRVHAPAQDYSNIIAVFGETLPTLPGYRSFSQPPVAPYTDDFMPAERVQQRCWESAGKQGDW